MYYKNTTNTIIKICSEWNITGILHCIYIIWLYLLEVVPMQGCMYSHAGPARPRAQLHVGDATVALRYTLSRFEVVGDSIN